jgi:hypothetical protein
MIAYPTRRGRRGALRDHETHDRIRKWREYQTIASLQHFVLVALSERRIEVYSRDRDGWQLAVVEPPDDAVFLKAIGASLSNSATSGRRSSGLDACR